MKKLLLAILAGTLCLTAPSSYAQKKNLVKGVEAAVTTKAPATLGAQVERQLARQRLPLPFVEDVCLMNKLWRQRQDILLKGLDVAAFQQKLKQTQQRIETLRASGSLDWWWTKQEAIDTLYDNEDKLAEAVVAFYYYYIDRQLDVFARAKYLKTLQKGRIYEIPLKGVLKLKVPGSLKKIPVNPDEYIVFEADGEKPHLVKRADVELLTDPSSYKLAE